MNEVEKIIAEFGVAVHLPGLRKEERTVFVDLLDRLSALAPREAVDESSEEMSDEAAQALAAVRIAAVRAMQGGPPVAWRCRSDRTTEVEVAAGTMPPFAYSDEKKCRYCQPLYASPSAEPQQVATGEATNQQENTDGQE